MIVIMFQPQFADKVRVGSKLHTIRKLRKRPVKVGDKLSLREWIGKPYQSKQNCLRETFCTKVVPITITSTEIYLDGGSWTILDPEKLTRDDGFSSYQEMIKWFQNTHGLPFEGVLIGWSVNFNPMKEI